MKYRHELIDKGDLLKEIDTNLKEIGANYNNHYDKNSVLWVRNIICRAEVKENKKATASIVIEPTIGNTVIYVCSHCGQYINIKDNFCCNCGCQFTSTDIPI